MAQKENENIACMGTEMMMFQECLNSNKRAFLRHLQFKGGSPLFLPPLVGDGP